MDLVHLLAQKPHASQLIASGDFLKTMFQKKKDGMDQFGLVSSNLITMAASIYSIGTSVYDPLKDPNYTLFLN